MSEHSWSQERKIFSVRTSTSLKESPIIQKGHLELAQNFVNDAENHHTCFLANLQTLIVTSSGWYRHDISFLRRAENRTHATDDNIDDGICCQSDFRNRNFGENSCFKGQNAPQARKLE